MLTDQQPAPNAPPPALPVQQHPTQQAPIPQTGIQSNVFAAAVAQAMGVLSQQQGTLTVPLCWHESIMSLPLGRLKEQLLFFYEEQRMLHNHTMSCRLTSCTAI